MGRKEVQRPGKDGRYRLQFIVDKNDFDKFEALRKEKFSSTSRQHLLVNEMFLPWLDRAEKAMNSQ